MNIGIKRHGEFKFQLFGNPDAAGNRQLLEEWIVPNGATIQGLNHMLDTEYGGGAQVSAWALGLINNSGFTALAAADTMAAHSGWTELTDYTEATRPVWTEGAAAGGVMTNSVTVDFTINASVSVKGAFLTSSTTKGGTTGTLASTGVDSTARSMSSGQLLRVTYTVTLTP